MRIAVMQPYFFPYLGYFQLINEVDLFVVYDDVQYTKKGWINRNRLLNNCEVRPFTLNLKKASDYALISEREISNEFNPNKLYRIFESAYSKSKNWDVYQNFLMSLISNPNTNLFEYLFESLTQVSSLLKIETPFVRSSSLNLSKSLRKEDKVLEICKILGAAKYLNLSGGRDLYSKETFTRNGINLDFITSDIGFYEQGCSDFVSNLTVWDTLFHLCDTDLQTRLNSGFYLA